MAYHNGYAGGYGPNQARQMVKLYRLGSGRLHLVPIGRSIPGSFGTDESWEEVSDAFLVFYGADEFTPSDAMTAVAAAWASDAGSSVAALKAAIHSALNDAGYGGRGGDRLS